MTENRKREDVFEETLLRTAVPLQFAGGNVRVFLEFLGKLARLCGRFFKQFKARPFEWAEFKTQCVQIGLNSLPIALFSLLFVGLIFAFQFGSAFKRFGAMTYVGRVHTLSMIRELGPVFTSLVVGGRVGAGMAAELGSMLVTEQIDAIRALGASPYKKLLVPRVYAATLMLPLITMTATATGLFSGMMIAWIEFGVSPMQFYNDGMRFLDFIDLWSALVKPVAFGFMIAIIGCYHGFSCGQGTASVGRATTQAVVSVSLMIVLVDFILTRFFALFFRF
jgi:phospholipid/cholesterol/gamma-HCH transport system permease protein